MTSQIKSEPSEPLHTAASVYRSLRDEGLMLRRDGTGRDDALWRDLVASLGFEPEITDLPSVLEERETTVEKFVRAFLTCFEPFAVMMADICAFMEKHDANRSYHSLAISYQFSDDDAAVSFNLSHFQDFWRSYHTIYERAIFRLWSLWNLRSYINDLEKHLEAYPDDKNNTENLIPSWEPGCSVPSEFQSDQFVWAHANILHGLWGSIEHAITSSADERLLPASPFLAGDKDKQQGSNYIFRNQELASLRPLTKNELSDLQELLTTAHQNLAKTHWMISEGVNSPSFTPDYDYFRPNSLDAILRRYNDLPTQERQVESLCEEIHSILRLPAWRYRWQLYQVWLGLFVLDSFQEQGLGFDVHAPNGRLELYEHHPAHIADLSGCKSLVSYWAELQTTAPGDAGEIQSIRPDYRLVRPPFTMPKSTLLLVEAKQQLSMTSSKLEKLYERYRAGCPSGVLLFANYDEFTLSDKMVGLDDTYFVSRCRPGSFGALDDARKALGDVARILQQEQLEVAEEQKTEEHKKLEELIKSADEKLVGLEFIGGLHTAHKDEKIGAIILDFRDASKCLFSGNDSGVRSHVIQYLRANPVAQIWLAGTNRSPVLSCHFNYDKDRRGFDRKECDLPKLIGELKSTVQGSIVIFGYSSALRRLSSDSRVITEGYSD